MEGSFYLPKIETRSLELDGKPTYIVRGYATTSDNIYPYTKDGRPFREFFTERAIENIGKKIKTKSVWVDIGHSTASKAASEVILDKIKAKTGADIDEEINYIKDRFKFSEMPMFKVEDFKIDNKGLFVDLRGNPFYRDIDEDHKNYFDSVWSSLQNGFINGMSVNMNATATDINDNLRQIDDADIYGISLHAGVSNDMANITEVATRCLEQIRGGKECQKISSLLL